MVGFFIYHVLFVQSAEHISKISVRIAESHPFLPHRIFRCRRLLYNYTSDIFHTGFEPNNNQ